MSPNHISQSRRTADVPPAVAARIQRLVKHSLGADIEMPWERGARREAMIARRRSRALLQAD